MKNFNTKYIHVYLRVICLFGVLIFILIRTTILYKKWLLQHTEHHSYLQSE